MHEMSIVQALLEQVQLEVEKSGHTGRVSSLQLVIGRLSGVHVDAIRLAFDLLSPESIAQGAELVIDEPHALLCCRQCDRQTPVEQLHADCPACGSADVTIDGGQDLILQSIELEEDE